MKRLSGIVLAAFFLMTNIFLGNAKAEGKAEFQFVQDYIKCLELLKSGVEGSDAANKAKYDNPVARSIARIAAAESQNNMLRRTHSYLDKYKTSPVETIKLIAKTALLVYDGRIAINDEVIKNLTQVYSTNPSQAFF